ncbi:MAG: MBL fold metallo-hydrolase [Acidobacteriota bacterium]
MSVNRRQFLTSSSLALVGSALPLRDLFAQVAAQAAGQAPAAPPVTAFTPLRGTVGFFTGQGGTIGYHISKTGVVVVDAQMPATAEICLDGVKERAAGVAIDYLVNTHHHGDHTGGNPIFRPAVKKILAHANVPDLQRAAAARQIAARQAAGQPPAPVVEQVVADTTFVNTWREEVGGEWMALKYYGAAHTSGDAVVTFEQANVVHMGDLIFNRRHPVIDRPGGSSVVNWVKVLEGALKDHGKDTIYVFGHAAAQFPATGAAADLVYMRDYLTALLDYVRAEMKVGKTKDVIVKSTDVLKGFDTHGPLAERVLTPVYDELAAG